MLMNIYIAMLVGAGVWLFLTAIKYYGRSWKRWRRQKHR